MSVRSSRRWRSLEEEEEEKRNPRITKESLRRICKEQKLYITPHLNDVLYLHYKGYSKIENLEEYTGLKCLWLENNGIDKIENLDSQKDLRSLYLHNNLIKEIENLEGACPLLDSLNLCHNSVSKIQNLSKLEHLHTLHISHNRLQDFSDVEHLKDCKELSCVDLQHNWLDDPSIVDIFQEMPSLRVLYLTGNPVVKKIPFYRKNLTVRCKKLTYLDDRPVFPKDRAAAEAWSEGGLEAEKACRQRWAEDERAKIDASVRGLLALRDKAKAEKFKQEMEKLELITESQGEDEEKEEEEEESEESSNESEPMGENLEAGDSEEITHNGIIFPWDLERDSRSRNTNEHGEGGRSLIVELPDPSETETKISKSVKRKSPKDPEIKTKLQQALLSAEWLQEKIPADNPPEEEKEKKPAEIKAAESNPEEIKVIENPVEDTPLQDFETLDGFPETIKKNELEDDEEIEKGALDNLIKEKQLDYHKYIVKTEEEILPNISHFSFQQVKCEENTLGKEIEEMLRIEKEEMTKMESSEEKREEIKKKLIEEMEKTKYVLEDPGNVGYAEEELDDVTQLPGKQIPKGLVQTEVDNIIQKAVDLLDKTRLINEAEANEVLDNGVKIIDKLNTIGRLPLKEKEANDDGTPPSSDEEFEDVEEEPVLTLSEEFPLVGGTGKNKLESHDSEEYYSFVIEDEEVSLNQNQIDGRTEKMDCDERSKHNEEETEEREMKETQDERVDIIEEETSEDNCIRIHKKNITSSIELQLVTEKEEEKED